MKATSGSGSAGFESEEKPGAVTEVAPVGALETRGASTPSSG